MCKTLTLKAINNKHKIPLTAWAKMVAMAAPAHPHFKTRMQKKSRPIFKNAEKAKKKNGVFESPIALKIADK